MDSAPRERLAQRVLALSPVDQTEVTVYGHNSGLTRFARGIVPQNVATEDVTVKVRAVAGGRTGVAASNARDDADVGEVVQRAVAMARLAPVDPNQPQLPAGAPTQTPARAYAASTAQATPALRAELCDAILGTAQAADYWCAGFASTSCSGVTIVNSSGAAASFDGTDAAVNVKMSAADSTGYAEHYSNDVDDVDAKSAGEIAAAKARGSANPRAVQPGEWTVILEPAAFGELLAYLTDHFSARTFDEGSSFLSDGLDRRYFGENVTITDDYAHPLLQGMPFDYEGQPTQRLPLIRGGVAVNVVTDSYWAHKLGRPNTGHALPSPNARGPAPLHVAVSPGTKSIDELIGQTARGLLITRFWYIRPVDRKRVIVTGMTRDGTFSIENGEISGGVRNMRFNQSILETLRRCELSNTLKRTGSYAYSLAVPAAKVEGFRFSSGTEF